MVKVGLFSDVKELGSRRVVMEKNKSAAGDREYGYYGTGGDEEANVNSSKVDVPLSDRASH